MASIGSVALGMFVYSDFAGQGAVYQFARRGLRTLKRSWRKRGGGGGGAGGFPFP